MNDVFKAIADPTRRKILKLLDNGSLNAGEIADHFNIAKPSISHHLSILKNANLITSEREGQNIIYELNTTVLEEILLWFKEFSLNTEKDEGVLNYE